MSRGVAERLALVVDPDAVEAEWYRTILAPVSSEVEYAADGRDALAMAIGHAPRLVLTEMRLPFIDGYTLCSLLRADPLTAGILLVVVVDDGDGDVALAHSSGADSVLTRPFEPDALLAAVARGRTAAPPVPPRQEAPSGAAAGPNGASNGGRASSTRDVPCFLVRGHRRFETSSPPLPPPPLRCPSCDQMLRYENSHIGGVSARQSEQWDYFSCPECRITFQYRHRTRRLRPYVHAVTRRSL